MLKCLGAPGGGRCARGSRSCFLFILFFWNWKKFFHSRKEIFVVVFWNRDLRQRGKCFRLFFGVVGSRRGSRKMDWEEEGKIFFFRAKSEGKDGGLCSCSLHISVWWLCAGTDRYEHWPGTYPPSAPLPQCFRSLKPSVSFVSEAKVVSGLQSLRMFFRRRVSEMLFFAVAESTRVFSWKATLQGLIPLSDLHRCCKNLAGLLYCLWNRFCLSLDFVLPWFHIPYASFFFAKNKRCLIISLFWKLVVIPL